MIDDQAAAEVASLMLGMNHVDEGAALTVAGKGAAEPGLMITRRDRAIAGEIEARHGMTSANPPMTINVRNVAHD